MRLIDADALADALFEKRRYYPQWVADVIGNMPDAVVRCKDCKHRPKEPNLETYESGLNLEFPEGSKCPCRCYGDEWYSWYPEDNWFCADGERKDI